MPNHPTPSSLLAAQAGVVTRAQALHYLTASGLEWRLRAAGPWQVMLPGVYGAFTGAPTQHQRLQAALLYAGDGAFVTGATGCQLYALRKAPRCTHAHVAAIDRRRRDVSFVRFERTDRPTQTVSIDRLRVAYLARCVIDTARHMTNLDEVCALLTEPVQRGRISIATLAEELAHAPIRNSRLARVALGSLRGGARSTAEAKQVRLAKRSTILPLLHFNCALIGPCGFIASPDAYAEESGVAQEIDSVEFHIWAAEWKATMARRSRMVAAGIRVLEAPPSRLDQDPDGMLAEFESAHLIGLRSGPPPGVAVRCRDDCPLRDRPRILAAA